MFVCSFGQYEDHSKDNTVHMDSFLYDDDDIDDMCDQGVLSRNYCVDCLSKNVKPLSEFSTYPFFLAKYFNSSTVESPL